MKRPNSLLDLPVETAARLIVRRHLRDARRAAGAAADPADEPVRVLRATLRRARRALRDFAPYLRGVARRKDRRRLRRLMRLAGPARDLEAQLVWLRAGREGWSPAEAAGRRWLLDRLEPRHADAAAAFRAAARRQVPRLRRRLSRGLERYTVRVDPGEPPSPPTRVVVAALLERGAARLRKRLDRVDSAADPERAHRARRQARALRYLLEPFAHESAPLAAVLDEVRALQTLLGDLHDGEVFRDRLSAELDAAGAVSDAARAGMAPLLDQLWRRREIAFGEVEAGWLHGAAAPFLERVERLAAELRGAAPGLEIERKFLLREMPPLPEGAEAVWIEQGWLPGERLRERLRCATSREGRRWFRTVKLGRGVQRVEVEEETTADVFDHLWPLTEGRRVRKQRFRVPVDGLIWEIDRFADRDLVLAEVELDAPDAPVELPPWLHPLVEREVTDEPEFVNANLAR